MSSPAASLTTIRPVRDEDYTRLAVLSGIIRPGQAFGAEELRHLDGAHVPPVRFGRIVAERDRGVIGTATYGHNAGAFNPHTLYLEVEVFPEERRRGVGSALYAALLERVAAFEPRTLRATISESDGWLLGKTRALGYHEAKRDWDSRLDVATADTSPFEGVRERLASAGVDIVTLAELVAAADPAPFERALYDLWSEVRLDIPRAEPVTSIGYPAWRRHYPEAPDFDPAWVYLAIDRSARGAWIGLSLLWPVEADNTLYTGTTGVRRAWRGRGVATALKVRTIEDARAAGVAAIHTDNDTGNAAMLRVNDRFGFVRGRARISLVKRLEGAPGLDPAEEAKP